MPRGSAPVPMGLLRLSQCPVPRKAKNKIPGVAAMELVGRAHGIPATFSRNLMEPSVPRPNVPGDTAGIVSLGTAAPCLLRHLLVPKG